MADEYEQQNVHDVYQEIAGHFSATRFKVNDETKPQKKRTRLRINLLTMIQAWPIVERFLQAQPAGSVGLDVGCGNGKNMTVNKDVFIVGSDRYVPFHFISIQVFKWKLVHVSSTWEEFMEYLV